MPLTMNRVPEILITLWVLSLTPHTEAFVALSAAVRRLNLDSSRITLEEANSSSSSAAKTLVGFTTDGWNVGMRKYKDFLAVHKMVSRVQKQDVQCIEVTERELPNFRNN